MQEIVLRWLWLGICMFIVSFSVSYGIYPTVLRMARVWRFYDNPDARKLQKSPVPVLGGLVVYFAIFISSFVLLGFAFHYKLVYMLLAMGLLLAVGMIDDRMMLSVEVRFIVEILVISCIVWLNHSYINTFGGLWGIGHLSDWIAVPLSVFAGVGLVNAINLMDGVDGYSSSYVFFACCAFSIVHYLSLIPTMAIICLICAGSLLPFILHNLFGKKTKMYIGDSGTLMMGMMLTIFCFSVLKDGSRCHEILQESYGVGLIPLTLAIISISVFDTLRVMTSRILHGKSPFNPDRSHLHHLFVDAGFSHAGTTLSLLLLNASVIVGWLISWLCGAGIDVQLYVVLSLSIIDTAVFYSVMKHQAVRGGILYVLFCSIGSKTHWENTRLWRWMQRLVDDELFEEGKNCPL